MRAILWVKTPSTPGLTRYFGSNSVSFWPFLFVPIPRSAKQRWTLNSAGVLSGRAGRNRKNESIEVGNVDVAIRLGWPGIARENVYLRPCDRSREERPSDVVVGLAQSAGGLCDNVDMARVASVEGDFFASYRKLSEAIIRKMALMQSYS